MQGTRQIAILSILMLLATGCSMLPVASSRSQSPWHSYREAKAVFDGITPYQTTMQGLRGLQIDPDQTPNIEILSFLDIIELFFPNPAINLENLDPGLRACVNASGKCQAIRLSLQELTSQRHGNLLLDLFQFQRQAHQTGWRFNALLVLVDDLVVYKLWSGSPQIDEHLYKKNPLGPFQEPAELIRNTSVITTL